MNKIRIVVASWVIFLLMQNVCLSAGLVGAQQTTRARNLGIPFEGAPGPLNAITDVVGVEVGHMTLISGEGILEVGKGPVRTGVTAVLPRGKNYDPVFAGWSALNGDGEMTGVTWIEESGFLDGPIMITNSHSVGTVRDAVAEWQYKKLFLPNFDVSDVFVTLPVVAETYDGFLNDVNGFHVKKEDAFKALDSASSGPVAEGNVGGGTGMICHAFKGGIGTSSRKINVGQRVYTLGVLVQANHGMRENLIVAGVPVGREIVDLMPTTLTTAKSSIIVVVATDAPLLPHQLKRLAKRASIGIAKVGGFGENFSGDIFIAFSTANPTIVDRVEAKGYADVTMLSNDQMTPLFIATAQATEEAILNALVAAKTMTGIDGNTAFALPHDRLRDVLKKYNRLHQ